MKRLLYVGLLLFIASSFVLSQSLISSVDEKYENGNIKEITYHKKRLKKIELVKKETYYENGQRESERNFKDGKLDGKWTWYTKMGNGRYEVTYTDGTYDVVTFINNLHQIHTGTLISNETYEDGQYLYQGQADYDFSIYPYMIVTIKDGKQDGKWTWYSKNGQIERKMFFKNGKKDGKYIEYYENGQISEEGSAKDGKKNGKYTYYNEDGSIKKVEEWKDGELIEDTP